MAYITKKTLKPLKKYSDSTYLHPKALETLKQPQTKLFHQILDVSTSTTQIVRSLFPFSIARQTIYQHYGIKVNTNGIKCKFFFMEMLK